MSKDILQNPASSSAKEKPNEPSYEEQMTWHARWFLMRATLVVYVVSFTSSITLYWITKDLHYLLLASPTVLMPMLVRLLPMDERCYNLKMAKIDTNKRVKALEERVQKLEKELKRCQITPDKSSKNTS